MSLTLEEIKQIGSQSEIDKMQRKILKGQLMVLCVNVNLPQFTDQRDRLQAEGDAIHNIIMTHASFVNTRRKAGY